MPKLLLAMLLWVTVRALVSGTWENTSSLPFVPALPIVESVCMVFTSLLFVTNTQGFIPILILDPFYLFCFNCLSPLDSVRRCVSCQLRAQQPS